MGKRLKVWLTRRLRNSRIKKITNGTLTRWWFSRQTSLPNRMNSSEKNQLPLRGTSFRQKMKFNWCRRSQWIKLWARKNMIQVLLRLKKLELATMHKDATLNWASKVNSRLTKTSRDILLLLNESNLNIKTRSHTHLRLKESNVWRLQRICSRPNNRNFVRSKQTKSKDR